MNLATAIRERFGRREPDEQRYSLVDYIQQVQQFTFNGITYSGLQQTLVDGGSGEKIDSTVRAYIEGAYKANGVVFACSALRIAVFSQPRFVWQNLRRGAADELWSSPQLSILERPWPNGTTADLLMRMLQDVDITGNAYIARINGELVRLEPEWVTIVLERVLLAGMPVGYRVVGYQYQEGQEGDAALLTASEVAHFVEKPDPAASFRGMSWMQPVIRQVEAHSAAARHKSKFFDNGATPNMIVSAKDVLDQGQLDRYVEKFRSKHEGVENAYKSMFFAGAVDAKVVGADFKQMDFKATQGHDETLVAAAAGAHPVLVGLSEGMQGSSLNAGNFGQARRRFADGTMWPLWNNASGSLQTVVPPPNQGTRLWIDASGVSFLRDDEKDEADIFHVKAQALRTLVDGGWEPESAKLAAMALDFNVLSHTGKLSVQLQDPTDEPSGDTDDEGE